MARMPDNYIDLTVTSPPYGELRSYKGYSFDFKKIAHELYRVTKKGSVVVWVVNDQTKNGSESGQSFLQALYFKEKCGFNLHDTMIYAKNNPVPLTHNRYEQQFEYMFVFSKGKPKTFNPIKVPCKTAGTSNNHKAEKHYEDTHSMRKRDTEVVVKPTKYKYNIWFFTTGTGDKVLHNAPFPEQLANDHIISWSNEGDLVYDPMAGSGTVLKMAKLNNRGYIGSEIAEEYCGIIKNRLGEVTNE
jgi:site-specific DNA-methyltransferase (adenine-specific)